MRSKPFIRLWWTKRTTACVSAAYAATTLRHALNNIRSTKPVAQGQPLEMAEQNNPEIKERNTLSHLVEVKAINTEPPCRTKSYQHEPVAVKAINTEPPSRSQSYQSYQHLSHLIEVRAINFELWASSRRTRTSLRKDIARAVDDRSTELGQLATWFTLKFRAVSCDVIRCQTERAVNGCTCVHLVAP